MGIRLRTGTFASLSSSGNVLPTRFCLRYQDKLCLNILSLNSRNGDSAHRVARRLKVYLHLHSPILVCSFLANVRGLARESSEASIYCSVRAIPLHVRPAPLHVCAVLAAGLHPARLRVWLNHAKIQAWSLSSGPGSSLTSLFAARPKNSTSIE